MIDISKHITMKEATHTDTGLPNLPDTFQTQNMQFLAQSVFEPLRAAFGNKPIKINSFFRSKQINVAVNGSPTSQHCTGQAMDITTGNRDLNKKMLLYIKDNLPFDQLICEKPDTEGRPQWVHVSLKRKDNRYMLLIG